MDQYHQLLEDIKENGEQRTDRTGVGTKSLFGRQLRFDLSKSFPAITTKKLMWQSVVGELLWFLEGSSDERRLCEITHGTRDRAQKTIWSDNANSSYWKPNAQFEGDLGRVYGVQWREWETNRRRWITSDYSESLRIDQIKPLIENIKNNPFSRRHIISAWNVGDLENMALPPCHVMYQFYVGSDNTLSCHMYQRSVDVFLGLPFNIASYALLTHLVAHCTGLGVKDLIISTGDTHIYNNHIDQVNEQLSRVSLQQPQLWLNPSVTDIDKFGVDDIKLINYYYHSPIKAKMAV